MASVSANYSDMGHEIKATPEEVMEFNKEMENMGIPSYEEMGELLKNIQPNELINGKNFDINEGSISTYNYVAIPWSTVKYSDLKNVVNQQCSPNTQAKYLLGDTWQSKSGSNIIMPSGKGWLNYGYCHIFDGHMKNSILGRKNYTVNQKSQFQIAYNPYATIDIMRNVIDKQNTYTRVETYKIYKQIYNAREGQTVRVVLYDPRGWSNRMYDKYDWIVLTAYPIFNS